MMETSQSTNRQLVVTRVGDTFYGIAIDAVHEIIPIPEITPIPKSPLNMIGVINVRGAVVPVADLRGCLGFEATPFSKDTRIVLVTYHEKQIGLVVDGVNEVTTLANDAFQSMVGTHGESRLIPFVARFQGAMVLEIDHVRVIDDGLTARRQTPLGVEQDDQAELPQAPPQDDGGLNIELLEASFQLLAPQADRLAERFYEKLFDVAPSVRGLFPDDIAEQRKALIASIGAIVSSLRSPDSLGEYLGGLGVRHAGYGAVEGHYDVVGQVLLETMAELAGDLWTEELQSAWATAYGAIKGLMLEAAQAAPALSIAA
jgi:nitric oxide dioxygenase